MPAHQPATNRAAYFDVDGTLARSNIVGPLIFFRKRLTGPASRTAWIASLAGRGPYWLWLDKRDRMASNRAIYAQYKGLEAAAVRALAEACYENYWKPRLFPEGLARLERLKQEDVVPVLVTGSIDFLIEPLARTVGASCIAPALEEVDGRFTGRLTGPPLAGDQKSQAVRAHAAEQHIALDASFAFGDAFGDVPMLECVGHPVAVNPDRRLRTLARARAWTIERWKVPDGR